MNRLAELSRCRAATGLSEEDSLIWFGVGRATLERIEAGEVEPSDEVAQRIDRFLMHVGGQRTVPAGLDGATFSPSTPGPSLAHSDGPPGGGAVPERNAGAYARATGTGPAAFSDNDR